MLKAVIKKIVLINNNKYVVDFCGQQLFFCVNYH